MMKSFFKKLAFVMALAMVVSLAAPAATTAAAAEGMTIAYQNGSIITELNLTEVRSSEDLKAKDAPTNWKELGITWTSSNPAVATVDNNGIVTAVSEGTAVITVTCGDETATIPVNCFGAAKTYTAVIASQDGTQKSMTEHTMKIGEKFDFKFLGIKDYSRDKVNNAPRYFCEWDTTDPAVATVDKNGLVTAHAAGKVKLTLIVWNLANGTRHEVTPCWIDVAPDATPTPVAYVENPINGDRVNETEITVLLNFGKKVEYKTSDLELYRRFVADNDPTGLGHITEEKVEGAFEAIKVKDFSPVANTNDEIWRATLYENFIDGATYEVRIGNHTETFVASVGDVDKVVLEVKEGYEAVLETEDAEMERAVLTVTLYDAKGVDVTKLLVDGVRNDDPSNIFYELKEESNDFSLIGNEIEFYADVTAEVSATYSFNDVVKESLTIPVRPETKVPYGIDKVIAWTLINEALEEKADWTNIRHSIPAGEENYIIVALFQDTRGAYYTTHERSASVNYKNPADGITYDVLFTEDEEESFAKNGLYVQFKAMNNDKMLIETYGEVASFETGYSNFALYLYNQYNYGNEFVKEVYNQKIEVCHPEELQKIDGDTNAAIMMNTETEGAVADAYFSDFSKDTIGVYIYDNHKDGKGNYVLETDAALAQTAEFETELTSKQNRGESIEAYEYLADLVEGFATQLNVRPADGDNNGDGFVTADDVYYFFYREIAIDANDFLVPGEYYDNGTQVSVGDQRTEFQFKITEKTTGTTLRVTVKLVKLVQDDVLVKEGKDASDVKLVREYHDVLKVNKYYENFEVATTKYDVSYKVTDAAKDLTYHKYSMNGGNVFYLTQVDKKGNTVGYENKLYVGNTLSAANTSALSATDGAFVTDPNTVLPGSRVLVVKAPNNKVYPVVGTGPVANSVYSKKIPAAFAPDATSLALGVTTHTRTLDALNPADVATKVYGYKLTFRAEGSDDELVFAPSGKYVATIKTVESVDVNQYEFFKADISTDGWDITNPAGGANVTGSTYDLYEKDTTVEYTVKYIPTADTARIATKEYFYIGRTADLVKGLASGDSVAGYYTVIDSRYVQAQSTSTFKTGEKWYDDVELDVNEKFGNIVYASLNGSLTETITFNVVNDLNVVKLTGRPNAILDEYMGVADTVIREADDDSTMCEYIMEAFNFNMEGTGKGQLQADDILYYVYTATPTNNEVVINSVTFKVPVTYKDAAGKTQETGEWYRSTVDVNLSIKFKNEY